MINGDRDRVVPVNAVKTLVDKLKTQKGIVVSHEIVPGANHFFEDKVEDLTQSVERYLDKRAPPATEAGPQGKDAAAPARGRDRLAGGEGRGRISRRRGRPLALLL